MKADWKHKLECFSTNQPAIRPGAKGLNKHYWHVKARNGKIILTGGEDLTKNNRDQAARSFLANWKGSVMVVGLAQVKNGGWSAPWIKPKEGV